MHPSVGWVSGVGSPPSPPECGRPRGARSPAGPLGKRAHWHALSRFVPSLMIAGQHRQTRTGNGEGWRRVWRGRSPRGPAGWEGSLEDGAGCRAGRGVLAGVHGPVPNSPKPVRGPGGGGLRAAVHPCLCDLWPCRLPLSSLRGKWPPDPRPSGLCGLRT